MALNTLKSFTTTVLHEVMAKHCTDSTCKGWFQVGIY
jgi:hypothetical protein